MVHWPISFLPSPSPFDSTIWKQKLSNDFRQRMHTRARTLQLIILGKSFKPQHCAPKKTSICSKDHFKVCINYRLGHGIYVGVIPNINCFEFVWRLKWYPLGERWIVNIQSFTSWIYVMRSSKMSRKTTKIKFYFLAFGICVLFKL